MKQHIDAFLSGADSDNLSLDDGDVLRAMILAMRRALLKNECYIDAGSYQYDALVCKECEAMVGISFAPPNLEFTPKVSPHYPGCVIDEALTKAGLPDQESRDAARKELEL